jgi:hypothetical protein
MRGAAYSSVGAGYALGRAPAVAGIEESVVLLVVRVVYMCA